MDQYVICSACSRGNHKDHVGSVWADADSDSEICRCNGACEKPKYMSDNDFQLLRARAGRISAAVNFLETEGYTVILPSIGMNDMSAVTIRQGDGSTATFPIRRMHSARSSQNKV